MPGPGGGRLQATTYDQFRPAGRLDEPSGPAARRRPGDGGPADDPGNGQDRSGRPGPRWPSAPAGAAITPSTPRRSWPTRPADPAAVGASAAYARYQPLGGGPRHHAVELPPVAGGPFCRPGAHGRQCGAAQARLQRPPVRRCYLFRPFRARRLPRWDLPGPSHRPFPVSRAWSRDRRVPAVTLTGSPARPVRPWAPFAGVDGQAERAGAWWQRCLYRHAVAPTSCAAAAGGHHRPAARTMGSPASPPSASSSTRPSPTSSSEFVQDMTALVVGDPGTRRPIRPPATAAARDDIEELVADAVAKGARGAVRWRAAPRPGLGTTSPTVITGLTRRCACTARRVLGRGRPVPCGQRR